MEWEFLHNIYATAMTLDQNYIDHLLNRADIFPWLLYKQTLEINYSMNGRNETSFIWLQQKPGKRHSVLLAEALSLYWPPQLRMSINIMVKNESIIMVTSTSKQRSSYFDIIVNLDELTSSKRWLRKRRNNDLLFPIHLLPRLHYTSFHLCYCPDIMDGLL